MPSEASKRMAQEWREAHPWFRAGQINPDEFDGELAALLDQRAEAAEAKLAVVVGANRYEELALRAIDNGECASQHKLPDDVREDFVRNVVPELRRVAEEAQQDHPFHEACPKCWAGLQATQTALRKTEAALVQSQSELSAAREQVRRLRLSVGDLVALSLQHGVSENQAIIRFALAETAQHFDGELDKARIDPETGQVVPDHLARS